MTARCRAVVPRDRLGRPRDRLRRSGTLAALGCALACGSGTPAETPGASTAPRPRGTGAPPASSPRGARGLWPEFDRVRHWPPATEQPHPSLGHDPPAYLIEPRLTRARAEIYRHLTFGATVPTGFVVAAFHYDRESGAPGPVYAAEKASDGSWSYTIASDDGQLLAQGSLRACQQCHDQAPSDGLFGLPGETGPRTLSE